MFYSLTVISTKYASVQRWLVSLYGQPDMSGLIYILDDQDLMTKGRQLTRCASSRLYVHYMIILPNQWADYVMMSISPVKYNSIMKLIQFSCLVVDLL